MDDFHFLYIFYIIAIVSESCVHMHTYKYITFEVKIFK